MCWLPLVSVSYIKGQDSATTHDVLNIDRCLKLQLKPIQDHLAIE